MKEHSAEPLPFLLPRRVPQSAHVPVPTCSGARPGECGHRSVSGYGYSRLSRTVTAGEEDERCRDCSAAEGDPTLFREAV